jgi:hypothetical protein
MWLLLLELVSIMHPKKRRGFRHVVDTCGHFCIANN